MSEFFRKTDLENIFVENVMKNYDIYTNDNMNDYYCWFIGLYFELLENEFEYIEFYSKTKSIHINNQNEEEVIHEILKGRLSVHDAYIIIDNKLMIIKDADINNYDFSNPFANASYMMPLDEICFLKLKKINGE